MAECTFKENCITEPENVQNQILAVKRMGYVLEEDYYYDSRHHSVVLRKDDICIVLDIDLCSANTEALFDYSKYCETQNSWMASSKRLYRFYVSSEEPADADDFRKVIEQWTISNAEDMEISDRGGVFDKVHPDNTPLEKAFEDLFAEAYGNDALVFLNKEYSISLPNGRNAFIDYVVETQTGAYAIEENGVQYHHPQIIRLEAYRRQLEKQNTLSLLGFKTYRFSWENLRFKEQTIDSIRSFLGPRNLFRSAQVVNGSRPFKLYTHQENFLQEMREAREQGVSTSLIVSPTGTGKSQIAIEDIEELADEGKISRVLIMVPTVRIRDDWIKRLETYKNRIDITVDLYNRSFLRRHDTPADYYDYLLFDEAQHAQAANCAKTLQYFTPKFMVGLTATPDRLDQKKLEDIFGNYKTKMTLKEAIDKDVITNIRCYRLLSNIDLSMVRYNGKDYNYADLEKTLVVESRNELIVKTLKRYFNPRKDFYKQGIVFCVNIHHCRRLEKLMQEAGLKAKAVYGGNKNNEAVFEAYANKKIQFLLSCQLISEGWDSPQTEIVVMARPTLSKVLYTQQIGRGVRKYEGKECLYVIDVVDNYEGKLTPITFNAVFGLTKYSDFMGVKNNNHDYLSILGLNEAEIAMQEIDILTFEEKYKDYRSPEQAARELFIGTATLMSWYRKDASISSLQLPIGSRMVPYFSKTDVEAVRESHNLGVHDDTTILEDFEAFVDENTLTFSFKLIFLLSMLKLADKEGEVNMDELIREYRTFYINRLDRNLPVDRQRCPYDRDFLNDLIKVKRSILTNPFEKYERKRFIYYSKDLNRLSFHPALWMQLTDNKKEDLRKKERQFLEKYYENLGGL